MPIFIYRQDIEILHQCSDKHALQVMKDIREAYQLPKKRYISIDCYCRYFGHKLDTVQDALRLKTSV